MNHEIKRLREQVEDFQGKVNQFEKMIREVKDMMKLHEELSIKVEELKTSKEELSTAIQELKQQLPKESGDNATLRGNLFENKYEEYEIEEEEKDMEEQVHDSHEVEMTVENEEVTSFQKKKQRRNSSRNLSMFHSLLQRVGSTKTESGRELYNTNNIHMLATSIAYESTKNPTLKNRLLMWIMTFLSIFFVFVQVFIFCILAIDTDNPVCLRHDDCGMNFICAGYGATKWRQPRCEPCSSFQSSRSSCGSEDLISDADIDLAELSQRLWFNADFTPNVDIESKPFSDIFTSQEEAMICITEAHCEEAAASGYVKGVGQCSYVRTLIEKSNVSTILIFSFMSMIFSTYLYEDMREAEVENALLDFIISSEPDGSITIALFILRIINRARRYWLPLYTAYAAISIVLSDELSPKNITLNFLAVIFITEADNHIASFVFSAYQLEKADNLVEFASQSKFRVIKLSYIKRDSLFVSGFVIAMVVEMIHIVEFISPVQCSVSNATSFMFLFVAPIVVMCYEFLGILCKRKKPKKLATAMLYFLRMWIGFWLMCFMFTIALSSIHTFAMDAMPPFPTTIGLISTLCAVFRPHQCLNDSYVHSRKDLVINLVMTGIWLSVQGWVLYRSRLFRPIILFVLT